MRLAKINLLVGPNNAGKSNFIRALSFVANMIGNENNGEKGFLAEVRRNGWKEMLSDTADSREISMTWGIDLPGKELKYDFSFRVGDSPEDFVITKEALSNAHVPVHYDSPFNYFTCNKTRGIGKFSTAVRKGQTNTRVSVGMAHDETVFLQFEKLLVDNPDLYTDYVRKDISGMLQNMRVFFERFYSYSSAAFELEKIRQLREHYDRMNRLTKNGENYANVLWYFKNNPNFYDRYMTLMKMLIPDLESICVEQALDRLGVVLNVGGHRHYLSEMSDGTVKALLLGMLLCLPKEEGSSLLAIDEPELNLHIAWQKIIAKWILRTGSFEQCFVSTHSPDFLDEFTDSFLDGDVKVFSYNPIADRNIRELNPDQLRNALSRGWMLGDLYRVNDPSIGGWPW